VRGDSCVRAPEDPPPRMNRFLPDLVVDEDYPLTFGRYTLTGLLGEGGMARVFRAQLAGPRGFKKPVALKIVRAAVVSQDASLKRALVHEARIGGMLHHPNIVEVYELGEIETFPFIAMELVEGVGLDILVEKVKPLPPAVVLELGRQMCQGLHHAHDFEAAGIEYDLVHRDLKPSNVLLSRNGVVKIADFGIAKAGDMTGNTTATGIAKGTPAYMSPQQANAEDVDRRSDIFALGAILYELATGKRLFRGETLVSTLMAVLRVEERLANPGFEEVLEGVLPGLAEVVRTCLRHDPAARYPTCEHLEAALAGLRKSAPGSPPLRRWLYAVTPELEKSLEDVEAPRARAAVQHLTAVTDPTLDDRTESVPLSGATRLTTEPIALPDRPPLARWVAIGGVAVLLLGIGVLGGRGFGEPKDDPALLDLSIAPPESSGLGGTEEPTPEATPVEDNSEDGVAALDSLSMSPEGAAGDAQPKPTEPSTRSAAARPATTPRPTPKPPAEPTPEPTPTPASKRPDDVAAWEPDPEPTATPKPRDRTSTAAPVSREALERASRDRAPKRELLKERAFRVTDAKSKHIKQGRKWQLNVSARVVGSTKVKATLHLRAGSGRWKGYPLERTGSDRWSAEITLPNTVDRDVQYWIEAENLGAADGRVGRQTTKLGSEVRPQFHFLN
jgi:serine/threonine protein kinase